ncbi:hypothetical protein IFM46972_09024 [Aspergillus udagawae]|uniref:Uncharacterized protein n=1 Tax=Aspergillus udagawae TaxID=91492 RepID=A0A8H3PC00_9EURO|nr:hypothetical protein IFM46972_09024 [Aspergillus udagawae]
MDENVAASVLSQVCNLLQLLCGHAGPGRVFRGCEADLLRLWPNGRRYALDIEPEPVELQIYTGNVSTNGTQTFDVAGMIGPGDNEVCADAYRTVAEVV